MSRTAHCAAVILALAVSAAGQAPSPDAPGTMKPMAWVDPDRSEPEGMKY